MAPDTDDEKYISRINSIEVTPDDLIRASKATAEYEGKGSFEATIGIVCDLFPDEADRDKRQAIMFRMGALARIMTDPDSAGVTFIRREDGSINISDALLAAVATEPMILVNGREWFNVPSLMKKARRLEPEFDDE